MKRPGLRWWWWVCVLGLVACDDDGGGTPDGGGGDGGSNDGGGDTSPPDPCSDGLFCNGVERTAADGSCLPGPAPCDDGAACTTDGCDEATDLCSHELAQDDCASCRSDCTPDCSGRDCGGDGCGGSCGDCTEAGTLCAAVSGECLAADRPGTCASPLPLLAGGVNLIDTHLIAGDSSAGSHEAVPTCNNTSTSVEIVYTFTIAETLGIDARSSGYDTVLHLRRENPDTAGSECGDDSVGATVLCSDDASPPGDYGSRIAGSLEAGTYYLIVDGFDDTQYGAFQLSVRFTENGCVPACDGLFCSDDDGCGGNCGECEEGSSCDAGRCVVDECTPDCEGKTCGDDGCGGSCGECPQGQLCVPATSACESFPSCDHLNPTCEGGCDEGEFCGTDCACHDAAAALPDLVLNEQRLADEILFDSLDVSPESCAVVEDCVGGTGLRRLMRFSVEAINQGQSTLEVPPPDTRPDLFEFSPCHGHYHYTGFAAYELLDDSGAVVLEGRKQAYCMEDTEQYHEGPNVGCEKVYTCDEQGIQAGWTDLYGNMLDCQWLDITDIGPGDYQLRISVNPGRAFQEVSFDNNVVSIPVTIPEE